MNSKIIIYTLLAWSVFTSCKAQVKYNKSTNTETHPNLILTKQAVKEIKSQLGNVPLFDNTLSIVKKEVDIAIQKGIDVPVPKDMAGGYTHTQHKYNYAMMQKAGVLFQLLGDEKYAQYIKDMLMQYAEMFPKLGLHPQERSYARGKLFWQCLNDSNWLVYTSQAYDCIYSWLSKKDREHLNTTLFRPYADFLSLENPQFFNRIHNHSTWGNVAVGMIGLVMDDEELIKRALYGMKLDNIDLGKDNDGGNIIEKGQKSGFLANLDSPFSPDGYYTEGPYYQRYAMYPFLIFAEALQNKKPELKIFEYKNGVLIKAVDALLNLTDRDGEFFPLNDGQKGMSYYSPSLVSAVDIAYFYGDQNPQLLSVAKNQNQVQLDATGLAVAVGIKNNKEKPFYKKSIELTDGTNGDEGGVGILRYGKEDSTLALVMKYSAQGLSHGHYDKLSFSLYQNGNEVLQDYGLARFVNVEQKNGGGYLKENKTWAKQTIAHNTLIQDQTSHFEGKYDIGSVNHSEKYYFDGSNENFQIVSAKEDNAYNGTKLHRTMIMIKDEHTEHPYIIDIMKVDSDKKHQYDLPYYYFGQIIASNFDLSVTNTLSSLGEKNGYQHLWKEATANAASKMNQFTWMNHNMFYSISTTVEADDKVVLGRIGAQDSKFNLRRDPVILFRKPSSDNTVFCSILESHGRYNPVKETADNAYSSIEDVEVKLNTEEFTAISIKRKGVTNILILQNKDASKEKNNSVTIDGKTYKWKGVYYYNNK